MHCAKLNHFFFCKLYQEVPILPPPRGKFFDVEINSLEQALKPLFLLILSYRKMKFHENLYHNILKLICLISKMDTHVDHHLARRSPLAATVAAAIFRTD